MTHTHTTSYELEICLMMTHTHPYPRLVTLQNTYLFHVYRSVSLARMRRYTQLAYLFHQCATSLLSRDSCIADCTVRHPGVERPWSSFQEVGLKILGRIFEKVLLITTFTLLAAD